MLEVDLWSLHLNPAGDDGYRAGLHGLATTGNLSGISSAETRSSGKGEAGETLED